jgi:hypothetical protein
MKSNLSKNWLIPPWWDRRMNRRMLPFYTAIGVPHQQGNDFNTLGIFQCSNIYKYLYGYPVCSMIPMSYVIYRNLYELGTITHSFNDINTLVHVSISCCVNHDTPTVNTMTPSVNTLTVIGDPPHTVNPLTPPDGTPVVVIAMQEQ